MDLDGLRMQSVSGGGHWGGGLHISSRDHARFGLLLLRNGKWQDRQLLSERWIAMATSPTDVRPGYGYLWWLNSAGAIPGAPKSAFWAAGNGGNNISIDRENDLVIVTRWTREFQRDRSKSDRRYEVANVRGRPFSHEATKITKNGKFLGATIVEF